VLNDEETSSWAGEQNSPAHRRSQHEAGPHNPEFYAMKHFSASVLPGAAPHRRLRWPLPAIVAFANPTAAMFSNSRTTAEQSLDGNPTDRAGKLYLLHVPAKS